MSNSIPYNSFSVITFKSNNKQPTIKYEYYSLDGMNINSVETSLQLTNTISNSLQSILPKNEDAQVTYFYVINENDIISIKELPSVNENDNILSGPHSSVIEAQNALEQLASILLLQKISNMEYKA